MKILFVSSGNSRFGISPIVKAQGESLKNNGVELEYFTITGKGLKGYIKNIFRLRKYLKSKNFDLVHSHFFLSSVVATLSKPNRLVVSLMGSDVYRSLFEKFLINLFNKRWDAMIVKSDKMKQILGLPDIHIIPNGVDLEKFFYIDKITAKEKLGWNDRKYILFASSISKPEKYFDLANKTLKLINDEEIEIATLEDIQHELIFYYLNAADILLMTSKYEGSPNIIKEAMACNCPIVSTDIGDVRWVIGETDGCYLTSFDPRDIASKLKLALAFNENCGRTKGRDRIIELGLDDATVADKLINIYKKVLSESK